MYIAVIGSFDGKNKMVYDDNLEPLFEIINSEIDLTRQKLCCVIDTENLMLVNFKFSGGKYARS